MRKTRPCATVPVLSLSPSSLSTLELVYLGLIERRRVPVSKNKDAKQRQIELLFGALLVTTTASGDSRGETERLTKTRRQSGSHREAKNRLECKLKLWICVLICGTVRLDVFRSLKMPAWSEGFD